MNPFHTLAINKKQVKLDLDDFRDLLNDPARPNLKERDDILPFFKKHPQLSAFIGRYNIDIVDYKEISYCHEFDIFGDHVADLAIGDATTNAYCFVEFENAEETSIFKRTPKLTPEWSTRYEHGFSQLVDWILWLEANRGGPGFKARFNSDSIRYNMLLVIGRDKYLTDQGLRERMSWRDEHIFIWGKKVNCITFDKLYEDLSLRLKLFTK